jgi:ATP-binding cassette subfamily B protein RaxB
MREREVNEGIKLLKLTRIIVAHRPETIRSADRVINLDEIGGRAVPHLQALHGVGPAAVGHAGPAPQLGST